MRKIIVVAAALISLMSLVPVAMPASQSVTGTVNVQSGVCDLSASTSTVDFGSKIVPGQSGTQKSVTLSETFGNTPTTPSISGTTWCTGTFNPDGTCLSPTTPSMSIGQTVWGTGTPTTPLTGTPGASTAQVSFGNPVTVNLNVNIPAGQEGAAYTQTITFSGCAS